MNHPLPTSKSLLRDECGSVDIMGYLALVTIVGIGVIAGLATLRDGIAQEYTDLGWTLLSLDQSYEYTVPGPMGPVTITHGTPLAGHTGDVPTGLEDTPAGQAAIGMVFTTPGGSESNPVTPLSTETLPTRPGHTTPGLPVEQPGGIESDPAIVVP